MIPSLPQASGYVTDFENLFSATEKQALTNTISNFTKQKGNQIAVFSIDSITPNLSFKQYTINLGNHWGLGSKEKNNGLLFGLSKTLRQTFIASGTGTQEILTDSILQEIIDQTIIPQFKQNKYYQGVQNGLDSIILYWQKP